MIWIASFESGMIEGRTRRGWGLHNRECRERRDRHGNCPGDNWLTDREIQDAVCSAHRRVFVLLCYGRLHDDFVVDLTRVSTPRPGRTPVVWRAVGRPELRVGGAVQAIWRLAAAVDGSLYAVDRERRLWIYSAWGFEDSRWCVERRPPDDTVDIVCSAGLLDFQKADRSIWYLNNRGDVCLAGRPALSADVAGTGDASLDFPVSWDLKQDYTLWRNGLGGNDEGWERVGRLGRGTHIVVSQDLLFARR